MVTYNTTYEAVSDQEALICRRCCRLEELRSESLFRIMLLGVGALAALLVWIGRTLGEGSSIGFLLLVIAAFLAMSLAVAAFLVLITLPLYIRLFFPSGDELSLDGPESETNEVADRMSAEVADKIAARVHENEWLERGFEAVLPGRSATTVVVKN